MKLSGYDASAVEAEAAGGELANPWLYGIVQDEFASALLAAGIEWLPEGYVDTIASEVVRRYGYAALSAPAVAVERGWQPIESAPKNNARPLYLAHLNPDTGQLVDIDFDGIWQSESESWELPQVYYYWASANGQVEEPTHWAYQDGPPPITPQPAAGAVPEVDVDLEAIAWAYRKLLDFGCYASEQGALMGDRLHTMLAARGAA